MPSYAILCRQLRKTLKVAKIIYICILYFKYLETYLETLHSHFQPNRHFKMFKNSGSGGPRLLTDDAQCCVDLTAILRQVVHTSSLAKPSAVRTHRAVLTSLLAMPSAVRTATARQIYGSIHLQS